MLAALARDPAARYVCRVVEHAEHARLARGASWLAAWRPRGSGRDHQSTHAEKYPINAKKAPDPACQQANRGWILTKDDCDFTMCSIRTQKKPPGMLPQAYVSHNASRRRESIRRRRLRTKPAFPDRACSLHNGNTRNEHQACSESRAAAGGGSTLIDGIEP